MSNKYDAPGPVTPKRVTPGQIGDGKLGVYRDDGAIVGQVGRLATAATASRFTKRAMKLGEKDGKPAWVTKAAHVRNDRKSRTLQVMAELRRAGQLRQAKGSNRGN